MQNEHCSRQWYKAALILSPNRAQTTNHIQPFPPENVTHAQSTSDFGQEEENVKERKMESSAPVYKSERSFYPKIIDQELQEGTTKYPNPKTITNAPKKQLILTLAYKEQPLVTLENGGVIADSRMVQPQRTTNTEVRSLEAHRGLCEEKDTEPVTTECVSKTPIVLQEGEIKVMPDTPRYEATLSPTRKKVLAASYSGWGISTDKGFERLLEQGYDAEHLFLERFPIQDCFDRQQQEKEIRTARVQTKIAEAMFTDPNNNLMIKETIKEPIATHEKNRNTNCPANEETKTNTHLQSEHIEKHMKLLTPPNLLRPSLQAFEERKALSPFRAETKFCTPKRVATKVEAKKVLQKRLTKAMKNVLKSEEKVRQQKTTKVGNVRTNNNDQGKSEKYELMWEDIKETNQELYQSTPMSGSGPDDISTKSKTENDITVTENAGSYKEELINENHLNSERVKFDIKSETSKEEIPPALSSRKYKSETNLALKTSELNISKPDQGPRKSWKDENFPRGVYKSEAYMVPRQYGKMTIELKQELHEHQRISQELATHQYKLQTCFPVSKKQDVLKDSSKIYKISVTTVQKGKIVEKEKFHPVKKDLFSYKLNTCYKLPINQRNSQQLEDHSQENTIFAKIKAKPEWTTTIWFEQ